MEKIWITTTEKKRKLLKKREPFSKIKFYSIEEFLKIYPYIYNDNTLEYIMDKENVILPIAKIYLENILKYNIEKSNQEKCKFLTKLKQDLIERNLLEKNILLEKKLQHSEIILDEIEEEKYLKEMLKPFPNVILKETEKENNIPKCYVLNNIEEEIIFVGEQIINLLKNGILPNQIFIGNINDEYKIPLQRIFKMLHIPLRLKETTTLNQTPLGSKFIKLLATMNAKDVINLLKDDIKTKEEQEILETLIDITNRYCLLKKQKDFIIEDVKKTKRKEECLENQVREFDLNKDSIEKENYYFLLSFTNDTIPRIKKDEDYLTDQIRIELEIDTSKDKNELEKRTIKEKIKAMPHCIITYKKRNGKKVCYPSTLLEDLKLEIEEGICLLNVSNTLNKYILGKELDNYLKYGSKSKTFEQLNPLYTLPYRTYQNDFQKIPKEKIYQKLNNELNLSYTKLDTYNKCAFSYYIKHILKIIPFEETFEMHLGTILHKVLEQIDDKNFDFQMSFQEAKKEYSFSKKEEFFLEKLKKEFLFTIKRLEDTKKFTQLTESQKELELELLKERNIKISFKGIIDNLIYKEEKENTTFVVIDYKTGTPKLKESWMPLGFYLQLPTYLYLLKKEPYFKKAKCGGFYLQPLLALNIKRKPKENYEITKQKALKKIGYSASDKETLSKVDSTYMDSCMISGLKTKKDGEFYQYSKIFTQKEEETLLQLVENILEKNIEKILNGDFSINPKIIDNKENPSCEFCPLKDLCYHEPKDNVYLKSDSSFLKKEENNHGMDERTRISNP